MLQTIRLELQTLDVGRKALRSFGLLVGAVLLGLGGLMLWRRGFAPDAGVLAASVVGGLLMLLGLTFPRVLRPLYRVWMALAFVLGFVMTRVLLALVFYLAVTPIGVVMRVLGKDSMHRRPDPSAPTYWRPRAPHEGDRERLKKYY